MNSETEKINKIKDFLIPKSGPIIEPDDSKWTIPMVNIWNNGYDNSYIEFSRQILSLFFDIIVKKPKNIKFDKTTKIGLELIKEELEKTAYCETNQFIRKNKKEEGLYLSGYGYGIKEFSNYFLSIIEKELNPTVNQNDVTVNQLWKSMDKTRPERICKVKGIEVDKAILQECSISGVENTSKKPTKVSISNMYPHSKGWSLINV